MKQIGPYPKITFTEPTPLNRFDCDPMPQALKICCGIKPFNYKALTDVQLTAGTTVVMSDVATGKPIVSVELPATMRNETIYRAPTLREEAELMLADPDMLVTPPEWRRVMRGLLGEYCEPIAYMWHEGHMTQIPGEPQEYVSELCFDERPPQAEYSYTPLYPGPFVAGPKRPATLTDDEYAAWFTPVQKRRHITLTDDEIFQLVKEIDPETKRLPLGVAALARALHATLQRHGIAAVPENRPTTAQIERYIDAADDELGPECTESWVRAYLRQAVR